MKKKKTCSTTTLSQKVYEGDFYSLIYIVIKAKNASEVLNYNSIILFIAPEKLSILESCSNQFRMYIMLCTLYYIFIVRKLSLIRAEPLDNLEL